MTPRAISDGVASGGISVVVTTLNDRVGVEYLLPGIDAQTRSPDEVVFVDGGSSDGTLEALRPWCDAAPFATRLVVDPTANISAGRNRGIAVASNEWIACTDAGCRPAPGWLEAIDAARVAVDFVAGTYAVDSRTPFEQALAVAIFPDPEELDGSGPLTALALRMFGRRFRVAGATGRSMAFTKLAWDSVGGFPEDLYAGEDVAFSTEVVRRGFAATLVPAARVAWRPRPTWSANARMYMSYARGDVRRGSRRRYAVRAASWLGGPVLLLRAGPLGRALAAGGMAAYLSLPFMRARRRRLSSGACWRIPLVVALKDLSQLAGATLGLIDERRGRPQPRVARP